MTTISSSETLTKQCAIFLSVLKAVNIQGYSKLREQSKGAKIAIHWFGKYLIVIIREDLEVLPF